jgi:tetratricopeptide (TPR) repeat protein
MSYLDLRIEMKIFENVSRFLSHTFRIAILIISILISHIALSQNIDSLLKVYKSPKQADTNRIKALNELAMSYRKSNPDTAILLAEEQVKLAALLTSNKSKLYTGKALSTMGLAFMNKGNYPKALRYYFNSLKLREELGDKPGIGNCYNNIGFVYKLQDNQAKALEYYLKGLKLREEIGDKAGVGISAVNIGNAYLDESNYPKALEYYLKSLTIREQIGDKQGVATCYGNMGIIYRVQAKYAKAHEYYVKALQINTEIGDKEEIASCLNNIANIYKLQAIYSKALEFFLKALTFYEEVEDNEGTVACYINIGAVYQYKSDYTKVSEYYAKALKQAEQSGDKELIATCYLNMGGLYNDLANYKLAINYADSTIRLVKGIGFIDNERLAYQILATSYSKLGRYKEAFENLAKFKQLTDSIFNTDNSKQLGDLKTKFEVEKREAELKVKSDAEQDKLKAVSLVEKKRQQVIIAAIIGVLLLVIVFSIFLYKRFKVTERQKEIIEKQKQKVDGAYTLLNIKNKEITDSINYAERIQRAFLASKKLLDKNLTDYFVLFKPKDIVSGDFYWATKLSNDNFVLVIADSTGHGVPGAIMSILNIACIDKAVTQGINSPDLILNETRRLVIRSLKNDGSLEGGKDGMDASLLSFDFKNNLLQCACANNPVWIVRNNELIEIKPDRMPIGKHDKDKIPFTLQIQNIQKGDIIYTLTDGFADQFGGISGKKFKYKQLQELLLSITHEPMQTQQQKLSDAFDNWKGDLEQVDDVCLIGIKI